MRSSRIIVPYASSAHPHNISAEVLCAIFDFLVPISPFENNGRPTLGWVRVTHVCRRWRSIAIEHRALWTTLHTEYFAAWDVFLQRAGDLPLNIVEFDVFRQIDSDDLAKAIMPILPSAKTISLWSTERLPEDLGCLAHCDLMEDLTLSTIYSAICATSLPNFHANLRSLKLKSVLYAWNFRAVGLRKLEFVMLENLFPEVSDTWTSCFTDVLDTLKEMPFLEQLNLTHVMPSPPTSIDTNLRVALPRLRELTLRGITSGITTLWSLLDFPAETSVTIDSCDTFMTAANLHLLSESLRARFTCASVPAYSEVVVVEIENEKRPRTLWLDIGHSDESFGINKARRPATLPRDTSIIRLIVSAFMDSLLDRYFLDGHANDTAVESFYDVVAPKLLEAIPEQILEVLTVVAIDPSKVKREGVFRHATVEERPRPKSESRPIAVYY